MYYVIGDIHGDSVNLKELLKYWKKEEQLVFLGDYIDRGFEIKEVLTILKQLKHYYPETIFLRGNHDEMYLNYIENGNKDGELVKLWAMNGGRSTVSSIKGELSFEAYEEMQKGNDAGLYDFLKQTLIYKETENIIFVHAGLDMSMEVNRQTKEEYLWIREEFYESKNTTGKTIIFGHTPTDYIQEKVDIFIDKENKYIGIDLGNYRTKKMCGLKINSEEEVITYYIATRSY